MSRQMRMWSMAAAMFALGILGFSRPAHRQTENPQSIEIGVALTPAHFPKHSPEDIREMFTLGKEVGKYSIFIYQWSQSDLVDVARSVVKMSRDAGLVPIVGISPTVLAGMRGDYDAPASVRAKMGRKKLSFADRNVHLPYIATVLELAKLKVPYLCLATEINMLAHANVKEYIYFAAVCKRLYPEIKKISPDTKVFVSFQWDIYSALDVKEPQKLKDHTNLIEIFRPELDLVAFTTYPSVQFRTPSDIPADYYANISRHIKPSDEVIFMEVGWPSVGKGSEATQLEFIGDLPRLLRPVHPRIVAWALLHDVTGVFGTDLGTTGLITTDGKRKPSFEALKRLR